MTGVVCSGFLLVNGLNLGPLNTLLPLLLAGLVPTVEVVVDGGYAVPSIGPVPYELNLASSDVFDSG